MNRLVITISILSISAVLNYSLLIADVTPTRTPLKQFPKTIGNWTMSGQEAMDEDVLSLLKVDDYILRTYSDQDNNKLNLYIGFFESQMEDKRIHSPNYCLPGGGWRILEARKYPIALTGDQAASVPVQLNVIEKESGTRLVLWWYQGRGRVLTNEYAQKFYVLWDALTTRRTDAALVRIDMGMERDTQGTLDIMNSFVDLLIPCLPRYIPE